MQAYLKSEFKPFLISRSSGVSFDLFSLLSLFDFRSDSRFSLSSLFDFLSFDRSRSLLSDFRSFEPSVRVLLDSRWRDDPSRLELDFSSDLWSFCFSLSFLVFDSDFDFRRSSEYKKIRELSRSHGCNSRQKILHNKPFS